MFHRQRPGIQVRPVINPEGQTSVDSETTAPPTPDFQPQTATEEEAQPMSNYTPQNTTPAENPAETMAPTPQASAQPYTPQAQNSARPAMPSMAQRAPYSYGQQPSYMGMTEATVSTGRKLVIGEGISMSGEIEACDHLVVEGTVEASLKGASVLDVSQSGMFFGVVEINEATIAGRFEGDLVVNGRLTVRATGTITGTIAYKELAVEAGATIDGKIGPMTAARLTTTEKKPQAATQKQGQTTKQTTMTTDPANELPFAGNKAAAA